MEIPPNSSLRYDSFLQKQDLDLSWIRHAMRGTSLLRDAGFVANGDWLAWTLAHWIGEANGLGGQLVYFRCGSLRREQAFRSTKQMGHIALLAGLLGACVLLAAGNHFSPSTQNVLIVAMGLLPLLAGIREADSYKKSGKELIKQFRFMSRLFESCRMRLQA